MSTSSIVEDRLAAPNSGKTKKRALGLIFFIMMMDVMGITLLSPVAPQIVLRFSSDALMVTMVTVIYAGGQFLASPVLGKLGDRYGRRPVILTSILGQALGYFVFGIGGSLGMLFLGRLIGGITAGNLSTASAYISDVSEPDERSKNFALIGTAWSLGLILGPALGGLFGQFDLEFPAYVAAGLSLLNVLLGLFLLPESLIGEKRDHTPWRVREINPILAIADMWKKPSLGLLLLVYAVFTFAFNGVNSITALYVIQKFSADTLQISLVLILSGVAIAITNTFLVPRAVERLGDRKMGVFGLIGLGLAYVTLFFTPTLWLIYPLNMLSSGMQSFVFPAVTTLSIDRVSYQEVGTLMGVSSAIASLMNVFGPLWAGLVYDRVMVGSPYWMGAAILALAAWLLVRHDPQGNVERQPVGPNP